MQAWVAPAKINLFLHIVGVRDDGYHLLQTAFQFLDVGDDLFFEVNRSSKISRQYDHDIPPDKDLCLQAANLLKEFAEPDLGVSIDLIKRLPIGGGLGGGSSNAATVLIALNSLWGIGLSREKLAELGLKLGADVPVFVMGYSAWAEGVGEILSPLEISQPWYLVLYPDIGVSTSQIFAHKDLTPVSQMKKIRALDASADPLYGQNQLEPIVRREHPQVDQLISWMLQFGPARMSGSGACAFLAMKTKAEAEELLAQALLAEMPSRVRGFVARGLNIHPLQAIA